MAVCVVKACREKPRTDKEGYYHMTKVKGLERHINRS